jgi:predicted protein tyrosine phosphatase
MPNEPSSQLPFSLAICGMSELPKVMAQFAPTHIVSVTDPNDGSLDFPEAVTVLRLAFWDIHVIDGMVAKVLSARDRDGYPNEDHAQAILHFGRQLPAGARVLIHCFAGVSRSTAAAYLLLCQHMRGEEHAAFELIKTIRPTAQPNRLIVKFGDRLLGAEKRMLRCIDR